MCLLNNGDFYRILIGWFIKLSVQMLEPPIVIYRGVILYIVIGDEQQFIGHCLIPLDPWSLPPQ